MEPVETVCPSCTREVTAHPTTHGPQLEAHPNSIDRGRCINATAILGGPVGARLEARMVESAREGER